MHVQFPQRQWTATLALERLDDRADSQSVHRGEEGAKSMLRLIVFFHLVASSAAYLSVVDRPTIVRTRSLLRVTALYLMLSSGLPPREPVGL